MLPQCRLCANCNCHARHAITFQFIACCRFYQHIPDSSDWAWRMCWGHASSPDLINWEHEPIALRPTPGVDCWSARHVQQSTRTTVRRDPQACVLQGQHAGDVMLVSGACTVQEGPMRRAAGRGAAPSTSTASRHSCTQASGAALDELCSNQHANGCSTLPPNLCTKAAS